MKAALRTIFYLFFAFIIASALFGCQSKKTISVGTTPGLYYQLLRLSQNILQAKYKLALHVVIKPIAELNKMVADGKLDANFYQTQQALALYNQTSQPALRSMGKTYITPMALYSAHRETLIGLQSKDKILVPQNAIEQSIALGLLKNAGVIDLASGSHVLYSLANVILRPELKVRITAVDLQHLSQKQAMAAGGVCFIQHRHSGWVWPTSSAYTKTQIPSPMLLYLLLIATLASLVNC